MLVFKRIRKALGLDRCHFPMTGAAPTNEETLTYFMSINIPLHEIYGMSETTGQRSSQFVQNEKNIIHVYNTNVYVVAYMCACRSISS